MNIDNFKKDLNLITTMVWSAPINNNLYRYSKKFQDACIDLNYLIDEYEKIQVMMNKFGYSDIDRFTKMLEQLDYELDTSVIDINKLEELYEKKDTECQELKKENILLKKALRIDCGERVVNKATTDRNVEYMLEVAKDELKKESESNNEL